jgi:hypothetical protein
MNRFKAGEIISDNDTKSTEREGRMGLRKRLMY